MSKRIVVQDYEAPTGLPKKTQSLCPECKTIIDADIIEKNGKAVMKKECDKHGKFEDVIMSDVKTYIWMESMAQDGVGLEKPFYTKKDAVCPDDCGMCVLHKSHTSLAILDLTNRCNLKCPICFANANSAGYVYEPTYDQVVFMMETLRAQRPVPTPAIQFSGGEPTIRTDLPKIIKKAWDLGFMQIQIATNGITMAKDKNYVQKLVEAHLHTVYLQFDGLDDKAYVDCRGKPLAEVKKKVIENCRDIKPFRDDLNRLYQPKTLSNVLVPTIVNTINDQEVTKIFDYAIKNLDVVRGINYQPVSFTGRIDENELKAQRFTLSDLVDRLMETGYFEKEDFFPVPSVTPISELTSIIQKVPKVAFTAHPHCGLATYIYITKDDVVPITRFMDIPTFLKDTQDMVLDLTKDTAFTKLKVGTASVFSKSDKIRRSVLKRRVNKYFKPEFAPDGLDRDNITDLITNIFTGGNKEALADFAWNTMYIGGMHFQDSYNYDIERVKRCVIHYPAPDGRIIPFCAYNGGPFYREEVEKKYSVPIKDWIAKRRKMIADHELDTTDLLEGVEVADDEKGEISVGSSSNA
ncbi:MAG: radical SAM protein [Thermoplasmata archaeon]|nr:MAG: radical SAM protein [Thermoplasmata archaeon]